MDHITHISHRNSVTLWLKLRLKWNKIVVGPGLVRRGADLLPVTEAVDEIKIPVFELPRDSCVIYLAIARLVAKLRQGCE